MDGSRRSDGKGLDRRKFITRAAAAGGVVWVTPAVLSGTALAAGSACGSTQTMNWRGASGTNPPGGNTGTASFTNWQAMTNAQQTAKGVGVRVDFTTGSGMTGRGPGLQTMGGVTAANNFAMRKNGATVNTFAEVTLRFVDPADNVTVKPVGNLNITFLDVDKACGGGNNWTDQITVTALDRLGGAHDPTTVNLGSFVTGTGPGLNGYPTFVGTQSSGGTEANVQLIFPATVFLASITIRYTSLQAQECGGDGTCTASGCTDVANTQQYIGINEFTWC